MQLRRESLESQLDIALRVREQYLGERTLVCLICLAVPEEHDGEITHKPIYWPLNQVITKLELELNRARI